MPDINVNEYQRLLNIIILENKLDLLQQLKADEPSADSKYKYQIDILRLQALLKQLTLGHTPENLLKQMLNTSIF